MEMPKCFEFSLIPFESRYKWITFSLCDGINYHVLRFRISERISDKKKKCPRVKIVLAWIRNIKDVLFLHILESNYVKIWMCVCEGKRPRCISCFPIIFISANQGRIMETSSWLHYFYTDVTTFSPTYFNCC